MTIEEEKNKQVEATNKLLLQMVKNQKENNKNMIRVFIITMCCMTILLVSMVVGFFVYESQFETELETTTETTITQEVSGEDSTINNVEGNQYNDNATHNQ
ncbi:MAG: hypothetical protein J6D28_02720 [Bacilli bacterium]|nr:hypothetical protein [Bacilli bacterium]